MGYRKKINLKIKLFLIKLFKINEEAKYKANNSDFTKFENEIVAKVTDFTMTSPERITSLIRATQYILENKIGGDIVECGVWKGGGIMAIMHTLNLMENQRNIYLYDTFEGMTKPSDVDQSYRGVVATDVYEDLQGNWCYSSLNEVKNNINSINYNSEKVFYVKGKVEDTIPSAKLPDKIALLRLDTDWYESTLHEMEHLFPRLVKGGVLIIDDYGHWSGCKKAVDEYLNRNNIIIFLSRVDYTCRIGIKM